jgi:hypothetical protein
MKEELINPLNLFFLKFLQKVNSFTLHASSCSIRLHVHFAGEKNLGSIPLSGLEEKGPGHALQFKSLILTIWIP